jgi:DNA mismatch endonuclease (patch repair protein)
MDLFSPEKRSEIMSRVRSRGNAATELRIIQIFRQHGITGWRRNYQLAGTPDFVFIHSRVAVFVDGCFWHGCPIHGSIPASNREFWRRKLARNRDRDNMVNCTLRKLGWRVVRVWQHELSQPERVARRILRAIGRAAHMY